MKNYIITIFYIFFAINVCLAKSNNNRSVELQRLIVTTDLGGTDPDDRQSMIHMLLCSDRMDIEGLISSQVWVTDPDKTHHIVDIVKSYGEILPHLNKHSAGFPDMEYLLSVIKQGQTVSNMDGVGEGKDSPGSELIIAAVDKKDDKRPVWIAAWGGMNTVAQALWKVKNTRSEKDLKKFLNHIRIYDILGQDDAGAWIAKNFPELFYIRNTAVYGWQPTDEWVKQNIQSCGTFGKCYPNRIWAFEGDSPSFFHVYANGLNVPECVDYGGWGGRFSKERQCNIRGMSFIEKSGKNEKQYDPYYMYGFAPEGSNAIKRWAEHINNDFAARMVWASTDDYDAANHHPIAVVDKSASLHCIYRKVKINDTIEFDATKSKDPDNDSLYFKWWHYKEPSTFKGDIIINGEDKSKCTIGIPASASGKTIHIILELTDNGKPALTSYRRIILEVE